MPDFKLAENSTNIKTELLAGATTFLAAMYIIVVNPAILSATGMPFNALVTATVLVSAFSSIMMGLWANNPILLAPGMGLNAFFTYSIVLDQGIPWETALGATFWSGIVFLLLSVFNIRTHIVAAIPRQIRYAVAAGIGLFITVIGFFNSKFIIANPATVIGPNTMNAVTIIFVAGLFITALLVVLRIHGALMLGIAATTLLAYPVGRFWGDATELFGAATLVNWQGLWAAPDFSLLFKLDLLGSLQFAMWPVIFAFLFADMFDSLSTFIGVAEAGNLLDENQEPLRIKQSLVVDSWSTILSGLAGSSSGTSYIESAAGIEEGGRTGLTAVVAGLLFFPFMFFSPLLSMVPQVATAPALILVGVFMMKPVVKINWDQLDDAIPAFLAMVLIPLTYSISQGIIWGFLSWTLLKLVTGKREQIPPMLYVIDVMAIAALMV